MIEEKLQKQMKRAMFVVVCMMVLFVICGGLVFAYLQKIKDQAVQEQVIMEAEEYKSRILKQLDGDFQTLSTLSVFMGAYTADEELLAEKLKEAVEKNDFLTMVYYDKSETGVIATVGKGAITKAELSELSPEGQEVVRRAMEGEACVSQMFESEISNNQVFVYSIPVYDKEEVIGVLAASDHIEIFSDILSGNTVLGGGGYIHMLDSEGDFLIRSSKSIVKEWIPSIYDGPYLSETSREEVKNALKKQERLLSAFSYQDETYPFLLEPVGFNNWYLFCVNTGEGLAAGSSASAFAVQITFLAVFLPVIFLLLYGYRLLRHYNSHLLRLAYYDSLTDAENLSRFKQRLNYAMEKTGGSVAAMSIRQFPFINEIFGKAKANRLLCQVKEAAEAHLTKEEFFCRDTEDRFYLFLMPQEEPAVRKRLEALMEEVCSHSEINSYNYDLTMYCGVAQSGQSNAPAQAADELMTHVLFALESAKGAHGNYVHFFDTKLHKREELENYVETHMQQALANGEFQMFLQPKKDLRSGRLKGAEALVRWKPEDGRTLYPDQFIPLFERNGFCVKLDLYMLEQACAQIRSWIDRKITPIPISVNQSKLLFFEADYVLTITEMVKKYDISPDLITLEILEGLALENAEDFNRKITELQEKGFRISLDDFGSGFSSLNTLNQLQINELKLDRGFLLHVSEEESGSRDRGILILAQVIRLAGQLGIATVAEGVETKEDEALLRELGCEVGQGYLYSRPISAEAFDRKFMEEE